MPKQHTHSACESDLFTFLLKVKVKYSCYRPGVAQRVGTGIALLYHDRGTRMISSVPRPNFTQGKDTVPILQEAGWAPRPIWTGGKSRLHRNLTPDLPVRSQSLYRLSYPANVQFLVSFRNSKISTGTDYNENYSQ